MHSTQLDTPLSSVLKSKIDAARLLKEADTVPPTLAERFQPLQNDVCEIIETITQEEFEPSQVDMTPFLEADIQSMLDAPSLKLIFSRPGSQLTFLGSISPALAIYACQHSLLFSKTQTVSDEDYVPSKLDCLLLQPLAARIGEALTSLVAAPKPLKPSIATSFKELGISKAQFKAIGKAVKLRLCVSQLASGVENENTFEEGALYIELILPRQITYDVILANKGAKDNAAPVIDPTHPWAIHMRDNVNKANVPVRAVVESCFMTVAECTRLEIGQVIALPGVSLNNIELFVDMDMGEESKVKHLAVGLAQGSLGIYKKNRALKMNESVDPDFIQDLSLHII